VTCGSPALMDSSRRFEDGGVVVNDESVDQRLEISLDIVLQSSVRFRIVRTYGAL
jgi:hypothetical protein